MYGELGVQVESWLEVRHELVPEVTVRRGLLPLPSGGEHRRLELEAPLVASVVLEDAHLRAVGGLDERRVLGADSSYHVGVVAWQGKSLDGEVIVVEVTTRLA